MSALEQLEGTEEKLGEKLGERERKKRKRLLERERGEGEIDRWRRS